MGSNEDDRNLVLMRFQVMEEFNATHAIGREKQIIRGEGPTPGNCPSRMDSGIRVLPPSRIQKADGVQPIQQRTSHHLSA